MAPTKSRRSAAAPQDGETYPRGNWWGGDDQDESDSTGHEDSHQDPNDPGKWIAHQLRKARFDAICGASAEDGKVIKLSPPVEFIGDVAGDLQHARRYNEITGAMNWGEGTYTRIPDGDLETLLTDVEIWVECHNDRCKPGNEVDDELQEQLKMLARRQKKQQHDNELTDTDILANVVDLAREEGAVE